MRQGANLKYAIRKKGLTVKQFSEMAGFDSYASMTRRFKLEELPAHELRHYADLLNIPIEELAGPQEAQGPPIAKISELFAIRERLLRELIDIQAKIDSLS